MTSSYSYLISLFSILLLLFTACQQQDGQIIKRGQCDANTSSPGSKEQYLVNNSNSHIITFTVKSRKVDGTTKHDLWKDSIVTENIETKTYTLNPGQEVKLNCERYFYEEHHENWIEYKYQVVGTVIEK